MTVGQRAIMILERLARLRPWLLPALAAMVLALAALALTGLGRAVRDARRPGAAGAGLLSIPAPPDTPPPIAPAAPAGAPGTVTRAPPAGAPASDPRPAPDWHSTPVIVKAAAQLIYAGAYDEATALLAAHAAGDPVLAGLNTNLAPAFQRGLSLELGQLKTFYQGLPAAQRPAGPLAGLLNADASRVSLRTCAGALPPAWLNCLEYNLLLGLAAGMKLSPELTGWLAEAAPGGGAPLAGQLQAARTFTRRDYPAATHAQKQ